MGTLHDDIHSKMSGTCRRTAEEAKNESEYFEFALQNCNQVAEQAECTSDTTWALYRAIHCG